MALLAAASDPVATRERLSEISREQDALSTREKGLVERERQVQGDGVAVEAREQALVLAQSDLEAAQADLADAQAALDAGRAALARGQEALVADRAGAGSLRAGPPRAGATSCPRRDRQGRAARRVGLRLMGSRPHRGARRLASQPGTGGDEAMATPPQPTLMIASPAYTRQFCSVNSEQRHQHRPSGEQFNRTEGFTGHPGLLQRERLSGAFVADLSDRPS